MPAQLKRIDIRLDGEFGALPDDPTGLLEDLTVFLSARAPQGWEELPSPDGGLVVRVHLEDHPLADALARDLRRRWPGLDIAQETIEREDWGASWMEFFTPIEIGGRFEIVPPWLAQADHHGREAIVIEPKMAFGTGHHPTTALCLEALTVVAAGGGIAPGGRFLDLGTGTGILGIGLCKLGLTGVGLDIDPQAIACAAENAKANAVAERFSLAVGSLNCLPAAARFEIVVANILAGPLREMAGELVLRLAPGAPLVLSGILTGQAGAVADAYVSLGLDAPEERRQDEWSALIFRTSGT
ncbi:MAG: 50S ribosomal protein L11 methyltransferase [Desulfovibrionaceae bacterium]|nr:50S ribosomal protein L11 methyltransferase [Desulfovibrionaceae bacterium]MBF0513082.1 50S ribosomal protein L11 methyltransferase [Desulfovibrionaceae bacterium]